MFDEMILLVNLNNPSWIILSESLKHPVDAQVVAPAYHLHMHSVNEVLFKNLICCYLLFFIEFNEK